MISIYGFRFEIFVTKESGRIKWNNFWIGTYFAKYKVLRVKKFWIVRYISECLSHKITFLSRSEIRNHYYALITTITTFIDAYRFICNLEILKMIVRSKLIT